MEVLVDLGKAFYKERQATLTGLIINCITHTIVTPFGHTAP